MSDGVDKDLYFVLSNISRLFFGSSIVEEIEKDSVSLLSHFTEPITFSLVQGLHSLRHVWYKEMRPKKWNCVEFSCLVSQRVEKAEKCNSQEKVVRERINKIERQIINGKLIFVDDGGKPLPKVVSMTNVNSDSEVEDVVDDHVAFMASTGLKRGVDSGYGTNSLLEQ
ncbi:hypothetical protein Tco_1440097 [Tanacetum coccineum]